MFVEPGATMLVEPGAIKLVAPLTEFSGGRGYVTS